MTTPSYNIGIVQSLAFRILREHVYAALTQYELTPTYWSMLGIIAEAKDGVRQVEIADALRVKAPLITVMVRELEGKKLIKVVPNQFDARAKLIALTQEGKKLIKTVETTLQTNLRDLLQGVSEDDLKTYQRVLSTIVSNDEAMKAV